jgi:hypothetical protein
VGITVQVFAVPGEVLERFLEDPDEADEFVSAAGLEAAGSLWLDKAGMGLLETFDVLSGDAEPPEGWVFGADQFWVGDHECPYLTPEQVGVVAAWIADVTDEEFRARARERDADPDLDYLSVPFAALRDFYRQAAAAGNATFAYTAY